MCISILSPRIYDLFALYYSIGFWRCVYGSYRDEIFRLPLLCSSYSCRSDDIRWIHLGDVESVYCAQSYNDTILICVIFCNEIAKDFFV